MAMARRHDMCGSTESFVGQIHILQMGMEKIGQVCDRPVCEWNFDGRDHSDRNGNAGTAAKGTGIQRVIVLQVLVLLRRFRVREWGEKVLITSSLTYISL